MNLDFVMVMLIAQKLGSLWAPEMLLIRCRKDSYFPPDVDKYTGYEKILERTDYGRLCILYLIFLVHWTPCGCLGGTDDDDMICCVSL